MQLAVRSVARLPPEFEFELDIAGRHHTMGAPGWYGLMRPGLKVRHCAVGPAGLKLEVDSASADLELAPLTAGSLVGVAERDGKRFLVPRAEPVENGKAGGEFGTVTQRTIDGRADAPGAPHRVVDPRPGLERWTVTDVLVVVAGEFGYPVACEVSVECDDGADHWMDWRIPRIRGLGCSRRGQRRLRRNGDQLYPGEPLDLFETDRALVAGPERSAVT